MPPSQELNDYIARNLAGCMRVNPDYTESEARKLLAELYDCCYDDDDAQQYFREREESLRRAITG